MVVLAMLREPHVADLVWRMDHLWVEDLLLQAPQ